MDSLDCIEDYGLYAVDSLDCIEDYGLYAVDSLDCMEAVSYTHLRAHET